METIVIDNKSITDNEELELFMFYALETLSRLRTTFQYMDYSVNGMDESIRLARAFMTYDRDCVIDRIESGLAHVRLYRRPPNRLPERTIICKGRSLRAPRYALGHSINRCRRALGGVLSCHLVIMSLFSTCV